ncbi:MAG: ABC transporter ATP-binding protein [Opitutales bacterium]|nr:ABC transporter ATP-binding protein [Opitutales bacterium]
MNTSRTVSAHDLPLLEVADLHKTFHDSGRSIHVLNGVNLSVPDGRNISICGQSGSGKSTFLNLISGLESHEQGSIRWNGLEIMGLNERRLARERGRFFGFIFQAYYLVPEINVVENVLLAARLLGRLRQSSRDRAVALLEQVGLKDRMRYPVQKLSGGERQRVAVARALMNEPKVILADEPTGNLDENTASEVMDLIVGICRKQGSSLILVTHNPLFARMMDQEYLLHEGVLNVVRGGDYDRMIPDEFKPGM